MSLEILQAEITNDPLTRGYSGMTDQQVVDSLNGLTRDANGSLSELLDYLLITRAHTNQGTDTAASNGTPSVILGRLILASKMTTVPADPFGAGDTPSTKTINSRELHSIKAFLFMLQSSVTTGVNFVSSEHQTILNDLINGGVMNAANRDAIIALSENKQSRATELGLPKVKIGHVAEARL